MAQVVLIEDEALKDELEELERIKRKKRNSSGEGVLDVGGLFRFFSADSTHGRLRMNRAPIEGIIHPSDGHPQEELVPDFALFRPLSFNNTTWTLYWPDLIV